MLLKLKLSNCDEYKIEFMDGQFTTNFREYTIRFIA